MLQMPFRSPEGKNRLEMRSPPSQQRLATGSPMTVIPGPKSLARQRALEQGISPAPSLSQFGRPTVMQRAASTMDMGERFMVAIKRQQQEAALHKRAAPGTWSMEDWQYMSGLKGAHSDRVAVLQGGVMVLGEDGQSVEIMTAGGSTERSGVTVHSRGTYSLPENLPQLLATPRGRSKRSTTVPETLSLDRLMICTTAMWHRANSSTGPSGDDAMDADDNDGEVPEDGTDCVIGVTMPSGLVVRAPLQRVILSPSVRDSSVPIAVPFKVIGRMDLSLLDIGGSVVDFQISSAGSSASDLVGLAQGRIFHIGLPAVAVDLNSPTGPASGRKGKSKASAAAITADAVPVLECTPLGTSPSAQTTVSVGPSLYVWEAFQDDDGDFKVCLFAAHSEDDVEESEFRTETLSINSVLKLTGIPGSVNDVIFSEADSDAGGLVQGCAETYVDVLVDIEGDDLAVMRLTARSSNTEDADKDDTLLASAPVASDVVILSRSRLRAIDWQVGHTNRRQASSAEIHTAIGTESSRDQTQLQTWDITGGTSLLDNAFGLTAVDRTDGSNQGCSAVVLGGSGGHRLQGFLFDKTTGQAIACGLAQERFLPSPSHGAEGSTTLLVCFDDGTISLANYASMARGINQRMLPQMGVLSASSTSQKAAHCQETMRAYVEGSHLKDTISQYVAESQWPEVQRWASELLQYFHEWMAMGQSTDGISDEGMLKFARELQELDTGRKRGGLPDHAVACVLREASHLLLDESARHTSLDSNTDDPLRYILALEAQLKHKISVHAGYLDFLILLLTETGTGADGTVLLRDRPAVLSALRTEIGSDIERLWAVLSIVRLHGASGSMQYEAQTSQQTNIHSESDLTLLYLTDFLNVLIHQLYFSDSTLALSVDHMQEAYGEHLSVGVDVLLSHLADIQTLRKVSEAMAANSVAMDSTGDLSAARFSESTAYTTTLMCAAKCVDVWSAAVGCVRQGEVSEVDEGTIIAGKLRDIQRQLDTLCGPRERDIIVQQEQASNNDMVVNSSTSGAQVATVASSTALNAGGYSVSSTARWTEPIAPIIAELTALLRTVIHPHASAEDHALIADCGIAALHLDNRRRMVLAAGSAAAVNEDPGLSMAALEHAAAVEGLCAWFMGRCEEEVVTWRSQVERTAITVLQAASVPDSRSQRTAPEALARKLATELGQSAIQAPRAWLLDLAESVAEAFNAWTQVVAVADRRHWLGQNWQRTLLKVAVAAGEVSHPWLHTQILAQAVAAAPPNNIGSSADNVRGLDSRSLSLCAEDPESALRHLASRMSAVGQALINECFWYFLDRGRPGMLFHQFLANFQDDLREWLAQFAGEGASISEDGVGSPNASSGGVDRRLLYALACMRSATLIGVQPSAADANATENGGSDVVGSHDVRKRQQYLSQALNTLTEMIEEDIARGEGREAQVQQELDNRGRDIDPYDPELQSQLPYGGSLGAISDYLSLARLLLRAQRGNGGIGQAALRTFERGSEARRLIVTSTDDDTLVTLPDALAPDLGLSDDEATTLDFEMRRRLEMAASQEMAQGTLRDILRVFRLLRGSEDGTARALDLDAGDDGAMDEGEESTNTDGDTNRALTLRMLTTEGDDQSIWSAGHLARVYAFIVYRKSQLCGQRMAVVPAGAADAGGGDRESDENSYDRVVEAAVFAAYAAHIVYEGRLTEEGQELTQQEKIHGTHFDPLVLWLVALYCDALLGVFSAATSAAKGRGKAAASSVARSQSKNEPLTSQLYRYLRGYGRDCLGLLATGATTAAGKPTADTLRALKALDLHKSLGPGSFADEMDRWRKETLTSAQAKVWKQFTETLAQAQKM
eukprot:Clim_evm11s216 gene=Clim_evmTU11s216